MKRAIVFLLGFAIALTACSSSPAVAPTPTAVACDPQPYLAAITPIASKWGDAVTLTGNTQRINLPPQIEALQSLRRDAQAVAVPSCVEAAHQPLIEAMDDTITAYLKFLAQKDEKQVGQLLRLAKTSEDLAAQRRDQLKQGKELPEPEPTVTPLASNTLQAAYDKAGFNTKTRTIDSGRKAINGTKDDVNIELVVDNEDVTAITVFGDLGKDEKQQMAQFAKTAQIALPEWTDAEQWLQSGVAQIGNEQTLTRGRTFISFQRLYDGTLFLQIDLL